MVHITAHIGSASIGNACDQRLLLHRKQCHSPSFITMYHTGVYMEIRGLVSRSGFLPPRRLPSKEKDGSDHALMRASLWRRLTFRSADTEWALRLVHLNTAEFYMKRKYRNLTLIEEPKSLFPFRAHFLGHVT